MFQKLEEGIKAVAAKTTEDLAKLKTYADGKFLGRMRLLTSADDCDNIKDDGVYWYSTASVPKNAPFANAAIIEVYGADNNTSQKIQRGTRYGAGGYSATRALFSGNWSEWYHYTLTTDGIVPVSGGGTGGKTIAEAQAALHLTQNYLYSQLDSSGNTSLSGIDAYPTRPGVFRITGNGTDFGMPTNYGCLVIFNGGSYYMHLYVNSQGFWVANTNSMTVPSSWRKMATMADLSGVGGGSTVSPTVTISAITGGHRVSITDVGGTKDFDVMDGEDGSSGADGVSVTHEWSGTTLKVTSASGTTSADLKGNKGDRGAAGVGIKSITITEV